MYTVEQGEWLAAAERRRDVLFAQLSTGYDAIEAMANAESRDEAKLQEYEAAWVTLKGEYDSVVEEIRRLI